MLQYDPQMRTEDLRGMWRNCVVPLRLSNRWVLARMVDADSRRVLMLTFGVEGQNAEELSVSRAEFFRDGIVHILPPAMVVYHDRLYWWRAGIPDTSPTRGMMYQSFQYEVLGHADPGHGNRHQIGLELLYLLVSRPPIDMHLAIRSLASPTTGACVLLDSITGLTRASPKRKWKLWCAGEYLGRIEIRPDNTMRSEATGLTGPLVWLRDRLLNRIAATNGWTLVEQENDHD